MSHESRFTPLNRLLDLSAKKAIVTGGAVGIGFAIAYRLAEAGAAVMIADINEEKAQAAAQEITENGFKADYIQCDASSEESIKGASAAALEREGGISILVNNAGIFPHTPIDSISSIDINQVLDVNLKGTLYFCREIARSMIERSQGGCIINLASVGGIRPTQKGLSVYEASKGAVITLTKSLAKELGGHNIRVNAIAPGGILTEGVLRQSGPGGGRSVLKEYMAKLPLGCMGKPDDVGRAALFLASDLSSYITGSVIYVDGGYLIS